MTSVVDTNVILVANGQHQDISPACVVACALKLQSIMTGGRIALDQGFEILLEYQNKTTPKKNNRPGDAFVKWALQNNANSRLCDLVPLEPHPERRYKSFPDDARLANFDPPDRKFVAVAAAHEKRPPILQAADSKWLGWTPSLEEHGITVDFLCPADIQRFHDIKFGND
ncbi:MAG: hypothetical protein NTW21_37030 [Verrucomicrobia bacterium]|nr:hypothetical protein [Verrucomicrobiota bacterium]